MRNACGLIRQLAVPLAIQLFPSAQADFNHPDGPCAHWGRVCPLLKELTHDTLHCS